VARAIGSECGLELELALQLHEEGTYRSLSPLSELLQYSCHTQSETFSPPNPEQANKGAQYIDTYHGYNGPIHDTFPEAGSMYGGPQQTNFINTIIGLTGIKRYKDLNGGTPNCVSMTPIVHLSFLFSNFLVSDM